MMSNTAQDEHWMQYALSLAKRARDEGEVPIGAVLVLNNEIVGEGWNQPISKNDPTAHAEIIALRNAAENLKNYRLINTTLYVTLEPCVMCAGAIIHSRVRRVVYGAEDPKAGAVKNKFDILSVNKLNHAVICESNVLSEFSAKLLRDFFQSKRS